MNNDRTELFENTPVLKAIMILAIPTILSSLVMILYNLADTYFVGMLNDAVQNAAVTFASPILLAFNAINNLFGVGSSSLMSRSLGSKDYDRVRKTSTIGFYCSLFFAACISIAFLFFHEPIIHMLGADASNYSATYEYMKWTVMCGAVPAILNVVLAYMVRSEGASLHASIGTMSGCILNMILDPFFILPWGLNMGAAGAGCATFISNCFACLYFVVLITKKGKEGTFVTLSPKNFNFNWAIILAICAVGIPASIQNLLNVTGQTILNNLASGYGTEHVAAIGITYKVNMVPVQIALGMSQGIMPLVSYCYASGRIDRMKQTIFTAAKICLSFGFVCTALFYCFSPTFISLFTSIDVLVEYGTKLLRGFCLGIPFLTFDFLCVGIYQAIGNGKLSLGFAIARKIILEIPLIIILNKIYPYFGLSYSQFCTELILAIVAGFVLMNIFKKLNKQYE